MQEEMTGQEIEENTLVNYWVNEYMKEKEKCKQLEKDYKLLNEKYEQALNDYDELLQSRSDCKVCEDAFLQKLSELNKLQWFYDTLNKALDIKDELNKALREENEELKNNLYIANTNHEAAEKECDHYRKALEEIEGYVKTTIRMPLERKVIINIIGKAKGEAND